MTALIYVTPGCVDLSSMLRNSEGQRVKLITAVFSNMHWQRLKEALSWRSCSSNQFLLCWGHLPLSMFLGVCSGSLSEVMVYTAMCSHRNISFHGLSGHSENLHGPRPRHVCLFACVLQTAPPTLMQLWDNHLHRSMTWFIQPNLGKGAEICVLVKQRSFMVNR